MSTPIVATQLNTPVHFLRHYTVPTNGNPVTLNVETGKVIVIVGPNGTGKSALAYSIYRGMNQGSAEFFPGHRQIYFSSEQYDFIGQPLVQLEGHLYSQTQHANRFRSAWSEDHLKSVLKRLLNDQFQFVSDIATAAVSGMPIPAVRGPIDVLNSVFAAGEIPISFLISEGGLKASRENGTPFGIDRLSDGERASLLLVGAVIVRPLNNVIIVDEPEKHLHEGISGPLIAAAVRARPDLAFVFTTHALNLIEWLSPSSILHVRNSQVIGLNDERTYDAHLMLASDGIDDELKVSIAGARKQLLFVEGANTSTDIALYSLLYPQWHIVAKGGADTVISNVRAVNGNQDYSWLIARGLIDLDGREVTEINALHTDGISTLLTPTVENLFVVRDVLWQMADLMRSFTGSELADDAIASLKLVLSETLEQEREEIVFRKALWIINRLHSASKLSVKNLRNGVREIVPIDVESSINQAAQQVDALLALDPLEAIVKLPIKNTRIIGKIADHFGYVNVSQYKASVLRQVELGSKQGKAIRAAIASYIPII